MTEKTFVEDVDQDMEVMEQGGNVVEVVGGRDDESVGLGHMLQIVLHRRRVQVAE
jgi:hypothetical protein